jgi:hypothetical protein
MAAPLKIDASDPRVRQLALDTLENLVAGLGTSADKRVHGQFIFNQPVSPAEAEAMYRNDWLSAAVIDTIPDDMVREWRTLKGLESGQIEEYQAAEQHYGAKEKLLEAMKWARLYGGAGVVLGLDGTGEFHEPLDVNRVRRGALKWLQVVDRHFLIPEQVNYLQPMSPQFGKPEFYRVHSGPDLVHRSRILLFHGVKMPYRLMATTQFWGGSILDRVRDAIMNSVTVMDGIASLVLEAKVDVFKMPDLFGQLMSEEGTKQIMNRLALAQRAKSLVNAVVMDMEEDYDQKTDALAQGLAPLVEQYLSIVAAASDIPVTRLLGTSAKGLNATGEGDIRNYYDAVAANQEDRLGPRLQQLDEVMLRSVFGTRPADFESEWNPLWQMDDAQQAQVDSTRSQMAQVYLSEGIIEPWHVAADLHERGTFSSLESEHVEMLKAEALTEPRNETKPDEDPPLRGADPIGEDDPDASKV